MIQYFTNTPSVLTSLVNHSCFCTQHWRTEIDERQESFHDMEDELQKARLISDRMFKAHNERDFDLDWHKEKADQLSERWQNIHSQIDSRFGFFHLFILN